MKRKYITLLLLAGACIVSGCAGKLKSEAIKEEATKPDYTLAYIDETESPSASKYVEASYYKKLLEQGTYKWGDEIYPVDMRSDWNSFDYMALGTLVETENAVNGFGGTQLCSGIVWVGEEFQNGGQLFPNYEVEYDKDGPGRLFICFNGIGGCCNIQIFDKEDNIVWEKKNVSEFFYEYVELDSVPEGMYGYVEDCTPDEEAADIFYGVNMVASGSSLK